jgi:hypothetical protein
MLSTDAGAVALRGRLACVWYQLQKSAAVDERFYNEQQAPFQTPKSSSVLAPLIRL